MCLAASFALPSLRSALRRFCGRVLLGRAARLRPCSSPACLRLSFPPPPRHSFVCVHAAHLRVQYRSYVNRRWSVGPAIRVLRPRCPCRAPANPSRGCAIRHGLRPLASLGTAVGTFFVGLRTDLRLPLQGVSPWCSCPWFAPFPRSPIARPIETLFVGSRLPSCPRGGSAPVNPCSRSAREGAVFFIVSPTPVGSLRVRFAPPPRHAGSM